MRAGRWSAAWRLALPRARADRRFLVIIAATVLTATVFVVAGPIHARAIATAGLQQRLTQVDDVTAGIETRARVTPGDVDALGARVRDGVAALGLDRFPITRTTRTPSATAPFIETSSEVLVVVETAVDTDRFEVDAGTLPTVRDGDAVEVAVHADIAVARGLQVGDRVIATIKTSSTDVVLLVVGLYRPVGAATHDELVTAGSSSGQTFDEIGAVAAPGALAAAGFPDTVDVKWSARLEPGDLRPSDLEGLAGQVRRAADELRALPGVTGVSTGVPDLLDAAQSSLRATDSAVASTTSLLTLLALATLVLAAKVALELREPGSALLRARGAGAGQLTAAAALEALVLVGPAVLLAPVLAVAIVAASDAVGSVAAAGLELSPTLQAGDVARAAVAASVSWVALTLPTAMDRSYVDAQRRRGRRASTGSLQRWKLDVAAVLLAALALWQLRQATTRGAVSAGGALDPAIVLAPPLMLLAGALVALRLVPRVGWLLARLGRRPRRLDAELAGAQVARRSPRYRAPMFVALLASGLAVYAGIYAATWSGLQQDRASSAVGADLAVEPARDEVSFPAARLDRYAAIDGVAAVTPVHRYPVTVARGATGLVVGLGVGRERTLGLREDLVSSVDEDPLTQLETAVALPSITVPPGTEDLEVDVAADGDIAATVFLRAVLADHGLLRRVSIPVPLDDTPRTLRLAVDAAPDRPVELIALEVATTSPSSATTRDSTRATITISGLRAARDSASTELPFGDLPWRTEDQELRRPVLPSSTSLVVRDDLRLSIATGVSDDGGQTLTWPLLPGPSPDLPELPAIVTTATAEALGVAPGDHVVIADPTSDLPTRLVATVPRLPGLADQEIAIAVDGAALAAVRYVTRGEVQEPDRWLLEIRDGAEDAVAGAIAGDAGAGRTVAVTERIAEGLRRDPVRLGLSGSLELGAIGGLVLAVLAAVAHARVDARRRRSEVAFLRAVGASGGTIRRWFFWEAIGVTGVSVALGVALAVAVSVVVLPSVGAGGGAGWMPPPRHVLPWPALAVLGVIGAALVVLPPMVIARSLQRHQVPELLRAGEDA